MLVKNEAVFPFIFFGQHFLYLEKQSLHEKNRKQGTLIWSLLLPLSVKHRNMAEGKAPVMAFLLFQSSHLAIEVGIHVDFLPSFFLTSEFMIVKDWLTFPCQNKTPVQQRREKESWGLQTCRCSSDGAARQRLSKFTRSTGVSEKLCVGILLCMEC